MELFKQFKPTNGETFNPIDTVKGETANSATEIGVNKNYRIRNTMFVNDTEVNIRRGQIVARTAIRGNYSVAVTDYIVAVTSLATAPTIGLPRPTSVLPGKSYIVKDEAGGATTTAITVRVEGEYTIEGSGSTTLATNYTSKRFYTDGLSWFIN